MLRPVLRADVLRITVFLPGEDSPHRRCRGQHRARIRLCGTFAPTGPIRPRVCPLVTPFYPALPQDDAGFLFGWRRPPPNFTQGRDAVPLIGANYLQVFATAADPLIMKRQEQTV
jgi:hypothetical protein